MDQSNLNSTDIEFSQPKLERRRKLLPWWVVGFLWIFLVFAAIAPFGIVFGLLQFHFELSLLGLVTDQPISLIGLSIIFLFVFKGVVALALWTEKTWAVRLAKIDAIISLVVCVSVMGYAMFVGHTLSLRLELIAIIPYYYKMNNIQYDWENFNYGESSDTAVPDVL